MKAKLVDTDSWNSRHFSVSLLQQQLGTSSCQLSEISGIRRLTNRLPDTGTSVIMEIISLKAIPGRELSDHFRGMDNVSLGPSQCKALVHSIL